MADVTLITGASSGIGRELAREFARNKHNLVLVARRKEKLLEVGEELTALGVSVDIVPMDLQQRNAPDAIFEWLKDLGHTVGILVNNAGYGRHGKFWELDEPDQQGMVDLNVTALTRLTRLFLPGMVERGQGRILNVASTAAFQPGPYMSVYYATKAYVLFLSEGLTEELKGTGVTVTCLCPGPTKSEFQERADIQDLSMLQMAMMSPEKVAKKGYRALMKGKAIAIPGFLNRNGARMTKFSPRFMVRKMVKKFQTK